MAFPFPFPCASVVRVDVAEDVTCVDNIHLQKLMATEPVAPKLLGKQPWPWPVKTYQRIKQPINN